MLFSWFSKRLLLFWLMLQVSESLASASKKPPHIVFIVADDLGWNDVSWHNPEIISPNLSWLARRGLILDSVYVQSTCTPSRNSLLTGIFPFHTELQEAIDPSEPAFLPLKYTTLPERLKERGYATHMVGKWHLGYCNVKYTPTYRGFDSFYGFYGGAVDHYTHEKTDCIDRNISSSLSFYSLGHLLMDSMFYFRALSMETGRDFWFNTTEWTETEGVYSTIDFANRAIDIINRHDPEVPLFLYLPFSAPHSPLSVPLKYERLYSHISSKERRIYSGMVSALDEAVGNITAALHAQGMMDNLLIVFTSDNGGQPYMGGNNQPLRGGKNTIWEGGTRVPTFVYSKNLLRKTGYTTKELFHAVDWFPTFLDLAGLPPEKNIDGISQWSLLQKGSHSKRTEFVYDIYPSGEGAIRMGDYKLIVGKTGMQNDWYPEPGINRIARQRFRGGKFDTVKLSKDPLRLYNIHDDKEERFDISKEKPEILETLLRRYQQYNATKVPYVRPVPHSAADPANFRGFWSPGWC